MAGRCNVVKMDLSGKHLLTLGTPDRADLYNEELKLVPTVVAISANGDIYVAEWIFDGRVTKLSRS